MSNSVELTAVSSSIYRVHHLDAKYVSTTELTELRDIERTISIEYNKERSRDFDIRFDRDVFGYVYISAKTHSAVIAAYYTIRGWCILAGGDITLD